MIELRNITKIYGRGDNVLYAVKDVNFIAEQGKFYSIIGKSGSGKSTLLNIIGALDKPNSGEVIFNGNDISNYKEKDIALYRNTMIGFIFQSFYLEPTYTVEDNIALPLLISGVLKKERRKRVEKILEEIGILELIDKKANELSGGQKQRIALARALITNPSIILADEPTGNLDTQSSQEVIKMLRDLANQGKTVIMVTHNYHEAREADEILVIKDGELYKMEHYEELYSKDSILNNDKGNESIIIKE